MQYTILLLLCVWLASASRAGTFYVDYSSKIAAQRLRAFDEFIVHPNAEIDLAAARAGGSRAYAYLSLVEVGADAPYRKQFLTARIPTAGRNLEWNSTLVDITSPGWGNFFVELAREAVRKGFDGFFLDTVESIEYLAERQPARAEAFRGAAVELIKRLKKEFPEQKIIMNRGLKIWSALTNEVAGVMVESLFQTVDLKSGRYGAVPKGTTEVLLKECRAMQAAGLRVYVLDYVSPRNRRLAEQTASRIEAEGFWPFISTPELDGETLAPLRALKRRVLTLFGNPGSGIDDQVKHPIDTMVSGGVQMPLEYLGYEMDYLNILEEELPTRISHKYSAIILDHDLFIPDLKERAFVDWLIRQKGAGVKVVLFGGWPFDDPEADKTFVEAFGMTKLRPPLVQYELSQLSPITGYETKVRLLTNGLALVTAPTNANVHISLSAQTQEQERVQVDAVFTSDWGGAAFFPYLTFRRPDNTTLWFFDPIKFLEELMGSTSWPVPDPTTRDGRRIFFSHIDGDGFRNQSAVQAGKVGAEVIMDRILTQYPLPITCSVIEAEMRGLVVDQEDGEAERLREIARRMFQLPNVEAGSHAFSHPFYWAEDSPVRHEFTTRTLTLVPPHTLETVDYQREIVGSAKYIEKELLPEGKKVEVFQWSGDCRPPREALEIARKAGLLTINGGHTVISRRNPSLTAVAPRGVPWGEEWQVYAACENENVYRDAGPDGKLLFPGGFINVIDTFKRTESPRRLKPVNIYYHFYSADDPPSLQAVKRAYDWAMQQPLHAITTSEYVRLAKDVTRTEIFQIGEQRYLLSNEGDMRTFRLPSGSLKPDIGKSRHITGYVEDEQVVYVHTDGSRVVELALASTPERHINLVSSSGPIKFETFAKDGVAFRVRDFRAVEVHLRGFPAGASVQVKVDGQVQTEQADAQGEVKLVLPREANVTVAIVNGS